MNKEQLKTMIQGWIDDIHSGVAYPNLPPTEEDVIRALEAIIKELDTLK